MPIEVYGNWGKLICDSYSGLVISYDRSNSDSESLTDGYVDIVRVDIPRYRRKYGNANMIDILHIGLWTKHGSYDPPLSELYCDTRT